MVHDKQHTHTNTFNDQHVIMLQSNCYHICAIKTILITIMAAYTMINNTSCFPFI